MWTVCRKNELVMTSVREWFTVWRTLVTILPNSSSHGQRPYALDHAHEYSMHLDELSMTSLELIWMTQSLLKIFCKHHQCLPSPTMKKNVITESTSHTSASSSMQVWSTCRVVVSVALHVPCTSSMLCRCPIVER